jgi:site-specific recombinase XerD
MARTIAAPTGAGTRAVEELALRIATDAPELADLPLRELAAVARAVLAGKLTEELRAKVDVAGIDPDAERDSFLATLPSSHTRRAYARALGELEDFARRRGRSVLELRQRDADAFLREGEGSPATTRLKAAAASSFYTFLERETDGRIKHPFRGTRARPENRTVRRLEIPDEAELAALEGAADPSSPLAAAIAVMAHRGLRVGALPPLTIKGGRFWTTTKGKEQTGAMPEAALRAIARAGLPLRSPFVDLSATKIADRLRDLTGRLFREGTIAAAYSAHDLRHRFAVVAYEKERDIYAVSKLLGHASVSVTEQYLRSLAAGVAYPG